MRIVVRSGQLPLARTSLFGLCHLLGYACMPRLADLKDQQRHRLDRGGTSSKRASVFRGAVDVALIAVWNSVRFAEVVAGLEATTGDVVAAADLARVSPLASAHVIPGGTYRFPRLYDPWSNISLVGGWTPGRARRM